VINTGGNELSIGYSDGSTVYLPRFSGLGVRVFCVT